MKNHLKMTFVIFSFLFLLAFASNASAGYNYNTYTYTDVSDSVSYSEDLSGDMKGFSLMHKSSVPRTNSYMGCDYYDWTYNLRKCRRTSYYNDGYYQDYYGYYDGVNLDYYRAPYNQDQALKDAFKTYQQSSRQQYQLESQRISLANRRFYGYYGYGGYGYGYSGARYYSYGW